MEYNKPHCWQYDIRINNFEDDLKKANLSQEDVLSLRVSDFDFEVVEKTNKTKCKEITLFIERHEWLGTMSMRPTHRFAARHKGILAGVIIMSQPNAFSKLLGEEYTYREKLISRGACISWSPKNLASALLMWSIRWMVKNTDFRVFTCYSDPEAKELGTIYQACNFYYLGKIAGATRLYFDPNNPKRGWFTERVFRTRSNYLQYAKNLSITWNKEWNSDDKIHWHKIPNELVIAIKSESKAHQNRCIVKAIPPKHKYCYLLGENSRETRYLQEIFKTRYPRKSKWVKNYPKHRGM